MNKNNLVAAAILCSLLVGSANQIRANDPDQSALSVHVDQCRRQAASQNSLSLNEVVQDIEKYTKSKATDDAACAVIKLSKYLKLLREKMSDAELLGHEKAEAIQQFNAVQKVASDFLVDIDKNLIVNIDEISEDIGDIYSFLPFEYARSLVFYYRAATSGNGSGLLGEKMHLAIIRMKANYELNGKGKGLGEAFLLSPIFEDEGVVLESWAASALLLHKTEYKWQSLFESNDHKIKLFLSILSSRSRSLHEHSLEQFAREKSNKEKSEKSLARLAEQQSRRRGAFQNAFHNLDTLEVAPNKRDEIERVMSSLQRFRKELTGISGRIPNYDKITQKFENEFEAQLLDSIYGCFVLGEVDSSLKKMLALNEKHSDDRLKYFIALAYISKKKYGEAEVYLDEIVVKGSPDMTVKHLIDRLREEISKSSRTDK